MKGRKLFLWAAFVASFFSVAGGAYKEEVSSEPSSSSFLKAARSAFFKIAADWTDPICKTHEYFRRFLIEEELHPTSFKISSLGRGCLLFVQLTDKFRQATVTTFPAMALRAFARNLHEEPFIHICEEGNSIKQLPKNGTFTLLSWNVCCVAAGYPISDGGVLPWSSRIDKVIDKIIEQDADVNCLYETFDTNAAFQIYERLKKSGYSNFYFNIGPKAVGASSGIFVASKYRISHPEFTPFSADSLVGRTKNVEKGVFAFDLESHGRSFARIFATHLQHSEEPEFSTKEERESREKQMQVILSKMRAEEQKSVILTGDLNLDDEEYLSSSWHHFFTKGPDASNGVKTWGGDEFCATLMGKKFSRPLNLDHTMVFKGSSTAIETRLMDVGFDGKVFQREALSDHLGLFSEITTS